METDYKSPDEMLARLQAVEEAWFAYTFEDAAASTPEEHIEAAQTFAKAVGNAVFGAAVSS